MARLHIFTAGTHRTARGDTVTITEEDLQAAVDAYDIDLHEAPVVIGHPKHDAPAYGWVKGLVRKGKRLYAEIEELADDFSEWLEQKLYKKVSASFYNPDHSPAGGNLYLRHVGFLGAMPPSVKGLEPHQFSEEDEGVIEFADARRVASTSSYVFRRLRDWMIERFGLEEADSIVPDWAVSQLQREADDEDAMSYAEPEPDPDPSQPNPDDPMADETTQTDDFAEEREQLDSEKQKLEQERQQFEAERARARHADFVEGLVQEGRVLPAHTETLTEALVQLETAEEATVEFGEEGEETPVVDAFRQFLQAQPKQVEFSEVAGPEGDADAAPVDFVAPSGAAVDDERMSMHRKAVNYAEQHDVDYITAVKRVGG